MKIVMTGKLMLVALFVCLVAPVAAIGSDAEHFEIPQHWSISNALTTYQEWDVLTMRSGNTPDFGWSSNPAGLSQPTLSTASPAFVSGSANFYSFSGNYSIESVIFGHGGAGGGGTPAGYGTHVIVQTAASVYSDGGSSVFADSVRIVDVSGNAISGGANIEALRAEELWQGLRMSTMGEVTQQELLWEFWLPGFTGDFKILADVSMHSMFMQMRVDTIAAPTAVPEPASMGLLLLGGGVLLKLRRRRRAGK